MPLIESLLNRAGRQRAAGGVLPTFGAGFLTGLIQQADDVPDPSRLLPGYIHVNSLLSFCPRRQMLLAEDTTPRMDYPKSADRVMWAIGRALEHHVRVQVIKSVGMASIYAKWKCACGKTEQEGPGNGSICSNCKMPVNRFHEATVFDHEFQVAGNPDLQLVENRKQRVVEIKSMNAKDFALLTVPVPNHIFQVNCYRRMLEKSGIAVHEESIILYVMKDYAWKSPYKEFHVHKDSLREVIDVAFEGVGRLRQSERDGTPLERLGACASPDTATAKGCPVLVRCWSGN